MMILAVGLVALAGTVAPALSGQATAAPSPERPLTLEQKLDLLAGCGLRLAEPFTPADLLASWAREEYERPGYDLVLVGLGMTEEQEPWRDHCANLWHFDAECIEDHGDYVRIVARMAALAQGSLPLADVRDHVDLSAGEAWVSFTCQGERIRLECEVDDDWVDPAVFSLLGELLARTDPDKVFVHYDLGGQAGIVGCVTRDELARLNGHGIGFTPLR